MGAIEDLENKFKLALFFVAQKKNPCDTSTAWKFFSTQRPKSP
jgi:hypothetical protein